MPERPKDGDHEPGDRAALDPHLVELTFQRFTRKFTRRDFEEIERFLYILFGDPQLRRGRWNKSRPQSRVPFSFTAGFIAEVSCRLSARLRRRATNAPSNRIASSTAIAHRIRTRRTAETVGQKRGYQAAPTNALTLGQSKASSPRLGVPDFKARESHWCDRTREPRMKVLQLPQPLRRMASGAAPRTVPELVTA